MLNRYKIFFLFFLFLPSFLSSESCYDDWVSLDDDWMPLVVDIDPLSGSFYGKRFRASTDKISPEIMEIKGLNDSSLEGLSSLNIMGSGAFTELHLQRASDLSVGPLFLFDLRQESHAFINGLPVSWYAQKNSANVAMTPAEVEADEVKRVESLKEEYKLLIPEITAKSSKGSIREVELHQLQVEDVVREAELAARNGIAYIRLYVTDHQAPKDEMIDHFLDIVRVLPENASLYFHCRGGLGRTTTFMVLYDIIKNVDKVSLEDILARQNAIGGKDLRNCGWTTSYKYEAAVERLELIKKFYQYAQENQSKHFNLKWSTWNNQFS